MSSEGSSKLRQFGLYKTIDSQTAEFLKLSRKRQIRRGCACAAVSTAITVTVVVVTLLIYEFGFRTDFKATQNTSRKLSWINVVNDSIVFNKHRNPAKNNGKLLAVILKSLDHKRYLETIIEESSLKPSHEQTTDYLLQKDVFSDAKIRKIPGYKPSRLLPNRRKDGIEKARKIIDYQRVITYLNSMSFTTDTDETTHSDISNIEQKSHLKDNFADDIFHQDFQVPKTETKRSNNSKAEPKTVPAQNLSCKCPYRSNLTEILEKLYKSIQLLHPKVNKVKSNDNKTNKKHKTIAARNQQSKNYSSVKRPSTKIKKIKHATTTMAPKVKTETNAFDPISYIRNNDTFESKISIIEQYKRETTTKSNFYSRVIFKNHKNEETDPIYDDAANVYIQTLHTDGKPPNNSTNENSSVSDVTVKHTQTAHKELYDFDDKLYNIAPGYIQDLNTSTGLEKNYKKSVEFNDFENYLSGLSKLENIIVNKPQTPAFIEDPNMKNWDFKRFLNHEIGDPIKRVSIPTEGLHENKQKKLPYQITNETPVIYKYKLGASLKENDEKPKSTSDFLVNGVDENIPLTPMMQSFLLSKKENGLILSLNEITTMTNKLQREDSSEDLPFHLRFFEDEEKFISLKSHQTKSSAVLKKDKKYRDQRVHDSIQISHEKARKKVPVNIQFDEDDGYLSNVKTDIATSTKAVQLHNIEKDEHTTSLNTHTTAITKEAQKRDIDVSSLSPYTKATIREAQNKYRDVSSVKTHTETTTQKVQQFDIYGEIDVSNIRKRKKATIKKSRKYDLKGDIDVSMLKTNTRTTTKETQKYDINGDINLNRLRTHKKAATKEAQKYDINEDININRLRTQTKATTKEAQNHDINADKDVWSLWADEKQRDLSRESDNSIKHSPKKSRKKAKKVPRIQLSTRKVLKPTEAPTTEHKRSKIKEIFYMTGDETPVDDFETKLSALMYFEDTPINYTALANSFLNKADSASVETSKSMMPETKPSNLEIRRNPEPTDFNPTSWYTNDEQSFFGFNF